ncbi:GNAT family N-acetyltransferase [Lelliottia sp. V89_10]|uniref:GNAT family N-acetyltransferase n=1 Tax=Lelliottia wanjuensis TaxID=3050585 RepID=UPI00249F0294|nr:MULTISPECIES: GNAT family N-acetyltransferase [unclassified Lelliottia]MDI3361446.1 GNAT family N-acetyltransferase [Lelliottia sp. V89_13]MDK9549353.1 GNAT family N-acetyltransferase [Lelliottia sp. V89_5]MDK9596054.1 GNAT family N-acetyltransferase [Lelliottia sp. V89_10]
MVDITCRKNIASQEFLNIVWDVFFLKKSRGRSLKIHFPWLFDSSTQFLSFEIIKNKEIVGGLIVAEKNINSIKVGLLGLVCIDERFRGKGYLKKLMDSALSTIALENFDAIYLWTSQHDLYKKYGFSSLDDSILVKVKYITNSHSEPKAKIKITERADLSIPPFASSIYQADIDDVSFIYCENNQSKYILSYNGILESVIKAFGAFVDDTFYINSYDVCRNEFLEAEKYAHIEIYQQNIQMVKVIKTESLQVINKTHFAANERI